MPTRINRGRWLRNGWVEITHYSAGGRRSVGRVGPSGSVTVAQAAALLDVSDMTVRRELREGRMVYLATPDGRMIVAVRELRRWRREHRK